MPDDRNNRSPDQPLRPSAHAGLRHVALFVPDLEACVAFYTDLLGMAIEWQPDADNVFLTSGNDNLALHRRAAEAATPADSRLDHIGFILDTMAAVDRWHEWLRHHQVPITAAPKTHRDGARSFYCQDPAGNSVQMIFHPPISRPE
ncbi:MAG: VOC family protein [Pseudomonadales bacterium]